MGICRVIMWIIGVVNLLAKSPRPPKEGSRVQIPPVLSANGNGFGQGSLLQTKIDFRTAMHFHRFCCTLENCAARIGAVAKYSQDCGSFCIGCSSHRKSFLPGLVVIKVVQESN